MSRVGPIRSAWAKAAVVVCVGILLLATTVEAAHIHDISIVSSTRAASAGTSVTGPETTCSICFAAHSPAAVFALGDVVEQTVAPALLPVVETVHVTRTFHFSLFVRPPPLG